jgi:hypothetical protein
MSAAFVAFPRPESTGSNLVLPHVWAAASARTHADAASSPIGDVARRIGPGRVVEMKPEKKPEPVIFKSLDPELAFYRKYTEALLTRFMKLSMESGRVPSLLGRELFNGHVTSYNKVHSFEDVVIFVHDVGKCIARLSAGQRLLIKRIALQGHSQGEAAALLGVPLRTVVRKYAEAVDDLTGLFLECKLLEPLKPVKRWEPEQNLHVVVTIGDKSQK